MSLFFDWMKTPRKEEEQGADNECEEDLEEICRTIDRSRKRLLSPGILRGDQAVDRLREQEAGASPLLKKSRPSPTPSPDPNPKMAMTLAEFKAYMDETTNKKLDSQGEVLNSLKTTVQKVDAKVETNTRNLRESSTIIKKNQEAIELLKTEVRAIKEKEATPPAWPAPRESSNDEEERAYLTARRSLRIWPVGGNTVRELWTATGDFMRQKLGLEHMLRDSMIQGITRADVPSGPGVKEEVIVVFKAETDRDAVLGAVGKLAGCVDVTGKPTAGVRIEVPAHLRTTFRSLFKYGQALRVRHGAGTRRHVKFDDNMRTLFLNAKLPGDSTWSRISIDVARRGLRAREELTNSEVEQRFDITGPARERSASLADFPPDRTTTRRSFSISAE